MFKHGKTRVLSIYRKRKKMKGMLGGFKTQQTMSTTTSSKVSGNKIKTKNTLRNNKTTSPIKTENSKDYHNIQHDDNQVKLGKETRIVLNVSMALPYFSVLRLSHYVAFK